MIARIQIRRDTASNWTANNPILTLGEIGYDTDTEKFKVGISSSSRWNDLPYELGQWRSDASGNISYGYASDGPAEGNVSINNDLFVGGDLTVKGTTTTINTEVATFKDDIIQLNLDIDDTGIYSGSLQSGFEVNRGNVPVIGQSTQKLYWDEASLKWVIDTDLNVLGDIYSNGVALWRLNGNDIYFDNGYVAIGLDNPSSVLHIKDIAPIITLEDENNPAHIWQVGQNADKFFINTETAADGSMFSMLEGGNVGIGTSAPDYKIDIRSSATDAAGKIALSNSDASKFLMTLSGHSGDNPALFWENTQDLRFATASNRGGTLFSEKLRIKANGNVGIGTDNPTTLLHLKDITTENEDVCLRLENDAQVWDLCNRGSDSNKFKLFDVTGNKAPFIVETASPADSLYIKSNGSVGINTSSPLLNTWANRALTIKADVGTTSVATLELDGCVTSATDQTIGAITFHNQAVASGSRRVAQITATTNDPYDAEAGNLDFYTTGTNGNILHRMRVASNGNVGIGTSSPAAGTLLHVQGVIGTTNGTAAAPTHSFYGDSDNGMYRSAVNELSFSTAGTQRLTIDSDGNVGIGTNGPSSKLHLNGSSGVFAKITDTSTSGTVETGLVLERSGNNTDYRVLNNGTFRVQTATNASTWTDVMTITSDGDVDFLGDVTSGGVQVGVWTPNGNDIYYNTGNVGINTSSPGTKLNIESNTAIGNETLLRLQRSSGYGNTGFNQYYNSASSPDPVLWGLNFGLEVSSDTNGKVGIKFESTSGTTTTSDKIVFRTANTDQVDIDDSGNLTATGTITSSSDITLKENIELISDPIEKVKELSGYTFNKKGEDVRLVGLIAQEVEKVLPEAVHENQEGLKSLAYGNLVALLVECVKKQDERIESLEKTIKEMK